MAMKGLKHVTLIFIRNTNRERPRADVFFCVFDNLKLLHSSMILTLHASHVWCLEYIGEYIKLVVDTGTMIMGHFKINSESSFSFFISPNPISSYREKKKYQ